MIPDVKKRLTVAYKDLQDKAVIEKKDLMILGVLGICSGENAICLNFLFFVVLGIGSFLFILYIFVG
jgi:hypothetical protein